jgi:hypothetical protein
MANPAEVATCLLSLKRLSKRAKWYGCLVRINSRFRCHKATANLPYCFRSTRMAFATFYDNRYLDSHRVGCDNTNSRQQKPLVHHAGSGRQYHR